MELKTGDLILTSKGSPIVMFMRFFQSDPILYGHAAVVKDSNGILEASWTLRVTPLSEFLNKKRHRFRKILRYNKLTNEQSELLVKKMSEEIGKVFSFKRIFLQMFDQIFYTNWFTSLSKDRDSQVCSSYVAWGFYESCGIKFNDVDWYSCEPDDIDDHTLDNPQDWTILEETRGLRKIQQKVRGLRRKKELRRRGK